MNTLIFEENKILIINVSLGVLKNFQRSRLDYFLIFDDVLAFAPKANKGNAYQSDHNQIILKLNMSKHPRGKGS